MMTIYILPFLPNLLLLYLKDDWALREAQGLLSTPIMEVADTGNMSSANLILKPQNLCWNFIFPASYEFGDSEVFGTVKKGEGFSSYKSGGEELADNIVWKTQVRIYPCARNSRTVGLL